MNKKEFKQLLQGLEIMEKMGIIIVNQVKLKEFEPLLMMKVEK